MQVRDIKRLLDVLGETDVSELTLETGEYKLTVRRGLETSARAYQQQAAVASAGGVAPTQGSPTSTGAGGLDGSTAAAITQPATQPLATQPLATQPLATPAQPDERLVEVVAPIVGTFYSSASPDTPPYVQVGAKVKAGAVLCIIEAMKLMNEIEAEVAGTVREVLVENDEPVEYGQVLFRIEPD